MTAPEGVPGQHSEGAYFPPFLKAPRANYRHGGNRPPFRARLVAECGHNVELIPVLTLYGEGQRQHWQCFVPPGTVPHAPFELVVDADPGRQTDIAVSVAVAYEPAANQVHTWPPMPRHHTPN